MSRPRFIGLLLALITLLAYLPASRYGFVNYDDPDYVTGNSVVQKGLTWTGIKWAFTTVFTNGHASYWHPLTWLSHMADCELFALNPGAHHLVSVLFHTANVVLLFLLLLRLTGKLWPTAFIAALFAWHPLHVESVAWISERKDVLSTFFGLLSLLFYARYAQKRSRVEPSPLRCAAPRSRESNATAESLALDPRPSALDYSLALLFFALGLMAKPMLVTLPFVMLLLDYWPLQRVTSDPWPVSKVLRLALEKWPFFLLAAGSCVVTFVAANKEVVTLQQYPLNLRIANALISYEQYLTKMIWPWPLACFYPLPNHLSWIWPMAPMAAAVLGIISWLIWRTRRQCPYLLVGWLWFLGTLVPVIGVVQVGDAAMTDRFTYFPLVGIFIAVTFGVCDLADRFQFPKKATGTAAVLILAACLILTENQLRYWHDSETLFAHALAVTKNNHIAHVNLGVTLEQKGNLNEALAEFRAAEQLAPELYEIHNNLGHVLNNLGHPNEALTEYREAMLLNPKLPFLHNSTGMVLAELGRFDEAMSQFQEAARLDPTYPWAHFEIGKLRLKQGRDAEAIDEFRAALRLEPNNFQILAYTAHVLATDEDPQIRDGKTALVLAIKAKLLTGDTQPFVLDALGMACAETGDFTNALEVTQRAIDLATAAKMKKLEPLQQRLELYKNHRPFRQSFTNAPLAELPKR
jgi:tetratricopeptide (TPR) repeat protein